MDVFSRVAEAALFGWLGGGLFLVICYLVSKFAFIDGTKKQQHHVQIGVMVLFFALFLFLRG